MEIIGKIKIIGNVQTFGEKGFRKRDVVVTTDEQYPQMILVEFIQDKCELLDKYQVGQDVKISINIRGREWTNPEGVVKYFNSIQGWRIENITSAPTQNTPVAPPVAEQAPDLESESDSADDLPF